MPNISETVYQLKSKFSSYTFKDQGITVNSGDILKPVPDRFSFFNILSGEFQGQQVEIELGFDDSEFNIYFEALPIRDAE